MPFKQLSPTHPCHSQSHSDARNPHRRVRHDTHACIPGTRQRGHPKLRVRPNIARSDACISCSQRGHPKLRMRPKHAPTHASEATRPSHTYTRRRVHLNLRTQVSLHMSQATKANICESPATIYHLQLSTSHERQRSATTSSNYLARRRCSKEVNERAWILYCRYFS